MVKKLGLFLISCIFLTCMGANLSTKELVNHLVNDSSASKKINLLFANLDLEDENNNPNIAQIIDILRSNSLIKLNYESPKTLKLSFKAHADATIFFRLLNETLAKLGYVYFIPTQLIITDKNISYQIQITSQYILDPAIFYDYLKKNDIYITDIRRLGEFDYEYTLDFSKAVFHPNTTLVLGEYKQLGKPLQDYVFSLQGAKYIKIKASVLDTWFPKILFLDKNLNLVLAINEKVRKKAYEVRVPKEVEFVVLSDSFDLDNIKRGLEVKLLR